MARRRRAAIARLQGRQDDALSDLQAILFGKDTTGLEFIAAVELLREVDSEWISIISQSPLLERLEGDQPFRLTRVLLRDPKGMELVISLMRRLIANTSSDGRLYGAAKTDLVLALISSGQFASAIAEMGNNREKILNSGSIITVFNYAMAEWGHRGSPPSDLMDRVLKLLETDTYRDANRHQCFALAHYICGNEAAALAEWKRAKHSADRLSGYVFSCWRYLESNRTQMQADLDALKRLIGGEKVVPSVFVPNFEEIKEPIFLN
jgi:hypothetical protein